MQGARPPRTPHAAIDSSPPAVSLFALLTSIYPVARAFFRVEVDYNEGWNIYNADRVAHHLQLYPVAYGWQSVNYPMLSFAMMAFLHRFTHDYLFTARAVSLLALAACCALTGAIVDLLSASRRAALLTGFFSVALFCTNADPYVGMDDPQLLAMAFYLLAFYLYLRNRTSLPSLAAVAALFVLAGSIKHNPLDFPLAVLIDLAILSLPRAFWFGTFGLAFAALSVKLNIHFGGPFFLAQMLAPRIWSLAKVGNTTLTVLGPILIPVVLAAALAWTYRRDPARRPIAILFAASLIVGGSFSGGAGVWLNTFFTTFFAVVILLGLALADLESGRWRFASRSVAPWLPAFLFASLIIPAIVAGVASPVHSLRQAVAAQRRMDAETALLVQQPSPQLCENPLICYFAGQPYVYDPFNATRLIRFHKLDPAPLLDSIRTGSFGAVELERHTPGDVVQLERFPAEALDEIQQHYRPVLDDGSVTIYLPKNALKSPK